MSHSKANRRTRLSSRNRRLNLESLEPRLALTGTWTALTNLAPTTTPGNMQLLTDGTVMVTGAQSWFRLTPDATGNYVNGTFSSLATMNAGRSYDTTDVLRDGRVFVLGDSIHGLANTGEMYNPLTDTWTNIAPFPEATFGNGPSTLLADGRVLAGSTSGPNTYIYDPATDTWSPGPTKLYGDSSFHEHWTKLSDGSILSYNVNGNPQHAQRLDQTTMTWIDSGAVPVSLQSGSDNLGSGVLLPDGRVLQIGANSNTAIYTPPATPGGTGTWVAGPVLPNGLIGGQSGASSGNVGSIYGSLSAAMMPNGRVLFVAGHAAQNSGPCHFFEFDPAAPIETSLTDVTPSAIGSGSLGFPTRMLMLPSGQVLNVLPSTSTPSQMYVYTPDGTPDAAWKPTITSVVANGNHYTLTGTQLNGLSVGASYGVGAEMDTNYPIVELKDASGRVYFAKTSNWSSTGVATGATPVSTDFSVPAYMPYGTYSLSVVANGIASDPVSFTGGLAGTSADLTVTYLANAFAAEGDNLTYNLTVTNNGPTNATGVVLKDTLGANLKYISATKSQGTFTQSGGVVTFSMGSIASGQTATATVTVQLLEDGKLTNAASVTSSVFDADLNNNSVLATTIVGEPSIVYLSGPISLKGKKVTNVQVLTFMHANGVEPASAFVATINWGDGSTSVGTVSLSGTTYSVTGSHTFPTGNYYTVTTTVVEAGASPNFAMALAPTTGTQSDTTATTSTTSQSDAAAPASPPRLIPAAVDQSLLVGIDSAPRHSRHASPDAADEAALDELFAVV